MRYTLLLAVACLVLCSCSKREKADAIFVNGLVYTVNEHNEPATAFAVKDGIFIAVGSSQEITDRFETTEIHNLNGAFVYPGFNDAHAHFYGYGRTLQTVDLTGTGSWDEVIERCSTFAATHSLTSL